MLSKKQIIDLRELEEMFEEVEGLEEQEIYVAS